MKEPSVVLVADIASVNNIVLSETKVADVSFPRVETGNVALCIMALLLFSDMMTGPIRYYLSKIGLDFLIYLPKFLCLIFIVIQIYRGLLTRIMFYVAIILTCSSVISYLHGFGVTSILFSIFLIAPFLFGLSCAQYLKDNETKFVLLFTAVFITTAFGIYLDMFVDFPWEGFVYSVGGQEIEGTRQWTTFGIDRLAGFARMSATAAFYLVASSLFLFSYTKSWRVKLAIALFAFPAILLTTNKAGIGGFMLGLASMFLLGFPSIYKLSVFSLTSLVLYLPVSTLYKNYVVNLNDEVSLILLASFEDRLINTWPSFFTAVNKFGNLFTGVGFGGVGSAIKYFSPNRYLLAVGDNFALYLLGCFGIIALWILYYFARTTCTLFTSKQRINHSLAPVMVALLAGSLTTDIIEAPVYALFLGIAIASAFCDTQSCIPIEGEL